MHPLPTSPRTTGHNVFMLPFLQAVIHRDTCGGLFEARKNASLHTRIFSPFPRSVIATFRPRVPHHLDHSTRSDFPAALLDIAGKVFWTAVERRRAPVPQRPPISENIAASPPIKSCFWCCFLINKPLPSHQSVAAASMYIREACLNGFRWYVFTILRVNYTQSTVLVVRIRILFHVFCRRRGTKPGRASKPMHGIDVCGIVRVSCVLIWCEGTVIWTWGWL